MNYEIKPWRLAYLGEEGMYSMEYDLGLASYNYLSGLLVELGLEPLPEVQDLEFEFETVKDDMFASIKRLVKLDWSFAIDYMDFVVYGLGIFTKSEHVSEDELMLVGYDIKPLIYWIDRLEFYREWATATRDKKFVSDFSFVWVNISVKCWS